MDPHVTLKIMIINRTNTSQLEWRLFRSKQHKILATLQNTGPILTMHQTSRLVSSYTQINYSSFFYPLPIDRAKRAAKYMNSTLNAIQIFPMLSRQPSRLVWWMFKSGHAFCSCTIILINMLANCSLSFTIPSKQPWVRSNWLNTNRTHAKKKLPNLLNGDFGSLFY